MNTDEINILNDLIDDAAINEIENIENIENKIKQDEMKKYLESYKDVLWIDDKASDYDEESILISMKSLFKDKESFYNIDTVKSFDEAVNKIVNNPKYSLVIFDIDLSDFFLEEKDKDYKKNLEEFFDKYNVSFDYDLVSSEERNRAGMYLCLLLISTGYPMSRIIILTGNGHDMFLKYETSFFGKYQLSTNKEMFHKKSDGLLDVDHYFLRNNDFADYTYYRMRRLVYSSCSFWKKVLNKTKNTKDIPFNNLLWRDRQYLHIKKNRFIDLLNHIELLFPIIPTTKPETIYYQALRELVIFHEDKARYYNINVKNIGFKYHEMMHVFRNWSAHNIFSKNEVNYEMFMILWCIFLRVYFVFNTDDKKSEYNNKLIDYEEFVFSIFEDTKLNNCCIGKKRYSSILLEISQNRFSALTSFFIKRAKSGNPVAFSDVIISQVGRQNKRNILYEDILLLFFCVESDGNEEKYINESVKCEPSISITKDSDEQLYINTYSTQKCKENYTESISYNNGILDIKKKIALKYPKFEYDNDCIDYYFYRYISYMLYQKYRNCF